MFHGPTGPRGVLIGKEYTRRRVWGNFSACKGAKRKVTKMKEYRSKSPTGRHSVPEGAERVTKNSERWSFKSGERGLNPVFIGGAAWKCVG